MTATANRAARAVGALALTIVLSQGMPHAAERKAPARRGSIDVLRLDAARKTFQENCAACHGHDGAPVTPDTPNFATGERLEKKDSDLLKTIRDGIKQMPAWKDALSATEQRDALAYVRGIVGDQRFQKTCNSCHDRSVPPLPQRIPKDLGKPTNAGDAIAICNVPTVNKSLTNAETIELVKLLRAFSR